eukprot:TRINITY_DN4394_c0_g1_i1.p2 TRINITY_DN4394_c0_g1~~TRINITY_DN4394_c0_g1_i1.p2  ORF type:complete len:496 (-),score=64.01 TRINITY_DN4394_c0_g1_i1:53-1540(-)
MSAYQHTECDNPRRQSRHQRCNIRQTHTDVTHGKLLVEMEKLGGFYYAGSTIVYAVLSLTYVAPLVPALSPWIVTFGVLICTHLTIYLLYRWWYRPSHRLNESLLFSNAARNKPRGPTSKRFKNLRKAKFPGPYPNSWYKVANLRDLNKDKPLSVTAFGQDMIVFLNEQGEVGVLQAYCPHMGAHLGINGTVVKGNVVCPWHNWSFNTKGECVDIPYSGESCDEISSRCHTKSYTHEIVLDMVFVWFDAEGRPPSWHVALPGITPDKFYYGGTGVLELAMHISEAHENSADYYHFHTLHSKLPVPFVHRWLSLKHKSTVQYRSITSRFHEGKKMGTLEIQMDDELAQEQEPERHDTEQHLTEFVNSVQMMFLGKYLVGPEQHTRVTFIGPSVMHFRIHTQFGQIHLVKTLLPLAPFHQYSEDVWFAEHGVPRFFSNLIAYIAHWALEQDRDVWENKMYVQDPILARGDGPFVVFRKWLSQFYSPNSPKAANIIDW